MRFRFIKRVGGLTVKAQKAQTPAAIFGGLFMFLILFQNCGTTKGSTSSPPPSASSQNSSANNGSGTFGIAAPNSTTGSSGPIPPGPQAPSPIGVGDNKNESIVVSISATPSAVPSGSTLHLTANAVDSLNRAIFYSWTINGVSVGGNSPNLEIPNIAASNNGAVVSVTASSETAGVFAKANYSIVVTKNCNSFIEGTANILAASYSASTTSLTLQDCANYCSSVNAAACVYYNGMYCVALSSLTNAILTPQTPTQIWFSYCN